MIVTNIVGQRVRLAQRSDRKVLGHGIVRAIDSASGGLCFLIEFTEPIRFSYHREDEALPVGSLFQISTYDETIEVLVDHEATHLEGAEREATLQERVEGLERQLATLTLQLTGAVLALDASIEKLTRTFDGLR